MTPLYWWSADRVERTLPLRRRAAKRGHLSATTAQEHQKHWATASMTSEIWHLRCRYNCPALLILPKITDGILPIAQDYAMSPSEDSSSVLKLSLPVPGVVVAAAIVRCNHALDAIVQGVTSEQ
jgi:hypothetical protein